MSECTKGPRVCGHRMVCEEADKHGLEPPPLCGDGFVQALSQLLLDFLELRPHAIPMRLPVDQEGAATGLAADEDKSQESEGLRLPKPLLQTICRCVATKLQQPGLVRVERKRELLKPQARRLPEAPGVGFILEAHNNVIGESHDNDSAFGFPSSPPLGPQIEDVVQIHVGEQWGCHSPNAKGNFDRRRRFGGGWRLPDRHPAAVSHRRGCNAE